MSDKRKQLVAQCKTIAHLAQAIADVHKDKAEAYGFIKIDDHFIDFVGRETAGLMNTLGDILNGMDAVTEEDEKLTGPVFEKARELWPEPPHD